MPCATVSTRTGLPRGAGRLTDFLKEVPERVKAANPETYVTPDAPPFFIQHGAQDPVVPVQMSIHLAAKLEQAIGRDQVRLELLEGAGHADPKFETPENVAQLLDWLDQYLKPAG